MSAILSDYHGITTSRRLSGEAQNRDALGLDHYLPAVYPQMAQLARIEGEVKITFGVNSETGVAEEARALLGHPLLRQAALDAVRQWRFKTPLPSNLPSETSIRFSLSCPAD
jgi:TonB family protein